MAKMGASGWVLLTGATGFLGRHLLRNLLAAGRRVALLVRDSHSTAAVRVQELIAGWDGSSAAKHSFPVVLSGDLRAAGLGLSAVDRGWLARRCHTVVHAAANVAFRASSGDNPWSINAEGMARLLEICAATGVAELHHVSTAYVCGTRTGLVTEEELDCGQQFHNEYERSKFEAERRVHGARMLRATVYRPSIIVGDSQTGATSSYHGLYRILEAAHRLRSRSSLSLRLPLAGDERCNLAPVDWVAQAIVRIMQKPACLGRTYHLVSPDPVPVGLIQNVAAELLDINFVFAGAAGSLPGSTPVEDVFRKQLQEYWPYLHGDPDFDCRNTMAALPDLPAARIDRALLARLIRYAVADCWGRRKADDARDLAIDCREYVERFLPAAARRSMMRSLPINVTVGFDFADAGNWTCQWVAGELTEVRRGSCQGAEVVFRTDAPTFGAVVRNRLCPQEAFLARRIEIEGDVERGLKLAVLFGQLVREFPFDDAVVLGAMDGAI